MSAAERGGEGGATLAPAEGSGDQFVDSGEVIVIGAGPGGLSAAFALGRKGIPCRILEREHTVGSSWRKHYEGLHMNSARRMSSLPGMRMDRRFGQWVSRNDFLDYLDRYVRKIDAPIEFGTEVERIDRVDSHWHVRTASGVLRTSAVVIATGLNKEAFLPDWPGLDGYRRELIHTKEYQTAAAFKGKRVLVIGSGASATDIALELREADVDVRLAIRTPPLIFPRALLGFQLGSLLQIAKHVPVPGRLVDVISLSFHRLLWGDMTKYGLGRPPKGVAGALGDRSHGIAIDRGLVKRVKRGEVEVFPAVASFDGDDVVLVDGQRLDVDVVIASTGQRTGLGPLVGHLGVLGDDARPLVHGGATMPQAPGLHFIGYRLPAPQLGDMKWDGPSIARRVRKARRGVR